MRKWPPGFQGISERSRKGDRTRDNSASPGAISLCFPLATDEMSLPSFEASENFPPYTAFSGSDFDAGREKNANFPENIHHKHKKKQDGVYSKQKDVPSALEPRPRGRIISNRLTKIPDKKI
jgi:hypothetical protein